MSHNTQPPDPALAPIRRAGRALFAGVGPALDERLTVESRTLCDPAGNRWEVPAPTFADPRLAALLAARREATMLRCALRWRGRAPTGAQITVLSSLPIPGLPPTTIEPAGASEGAVRVRG